MLSGNTSLKFDPKEFLRRSYENASVAPAYIFEGLDENAKRALAIYFAKLLNCRARDDKSRPCEACLSCRKIGSGIHPDVRLIELGGSDKSLSIDEIRMLKSAIALKPYEGKYKVFIICEAHLMNQASSNAILKVLEEPPPDSVIILLSISVSSMLATIISRCQVLRLRSKGVDLKGRPESLEGELEQALVLLRDTLVFKVTGDKNFLFRADRENLMSLSDANDISRLESDIRKLIELRDGIDRNANPRIVRDVFFNTMRRYGLCSR